MFQIIWHCGMRDPEVVMRMPVQVRKWWLHRTQKQLKDEAEERERQQKQQPR